jgi:hypothetical protein
VFAIHDIPLYYEISEDDQPRTVIHARDHWWTLDFANTFFSSGVNSRAELVLSPRAYARRWLGDHEFHSTLAPGLRLAVGSGIMNFIVLMAVAVLLAKGP